MKKLIPILGCIVVIFLAQVGWGWSSNDPLPGESVSDGELANITGRLIVVCNAKCCIDSGWCEAGYVFGDPSECNCEGDLGAVCWRTYCFKTYGACVLGYTDYHCDKYETTCCRNIRYTCQGTPAACSCAYYDNPWEGISSPCASPRSDC